MAEREGFEPSVREYRTPDFESGTFDHSATSPMARILAATFKLSLQNSASLLNRRKIISRCVLKFRAEWLYAKLIPMFATLVRLL
jgi:hypothetical protein